MPAFSPELLLNALARSRQEASHTTPNPQLQVICAWPVSGQYGPGSRVLFYVLIAACVFARKVDWLRNACLAGALLLPVVGALHAIVLAAVHKDGAVDMDVYGAFQLCAIGALAAPVTVRISRTYFNDPGRNTIFAWSLIVLAGLLSLTVEFYRLSTTGCVYDDAGNPVSPDPALFPYGTTNCSLQCDVDNPISPLRGGSANNIYVIPAPTRLTFNAGMLLSAACCIPVILLCVWMWIKILKENSSKYAAMASNMPEESDTSPDEGHGSDNMSTGGTACETSTTVADDNVAIDSLSIGTRILIIIFGGVVFAILVVGEWNLFSKQVSYQTEVISNIGQWQPIVGTGLVILGSFYLLLVQAMQRERDAYTSDPCPPVKLVKRTLNDREIYLGDLDDDGDRALSVVNQSDDTRELIIDFSSLGIECASVKNLWTGRTVPIVPSYTAKVEGHCVLSLRLSNITVLEEQSADITNADDRAARNPPKDETERSDHLETAQPADEEAQTKRKSLVRSKGELLRPAARVMIRVGDYLGRARQGRFGSDELGVGKAARYPTIPGEHLTNPRLSETRSMYGDIRGSVDSQMSRLSRQPSRPRSTTVSSSHSETRERQTSAGKRKDTISSELGRRDTLDVPNPASPTRTPSRMSQSAETPDEIVAVPGSPIMITVSGEPDQT